jgi:hypothetical protein
VSSERQREREREIGSAAFLLLPRTTNNHKSSPSWPYVQKAVQKNILPWGFRALEIQCFKIVYINKLAANKESIDLVKSEGVISYILYLFSKSPK